MKKPREFRQTICQLYDQSVICGVISESKSDDRFHPVPDVALAVALIQSKGTLVHISLEMLFRELMISAVEHPLQDRPNALDTISTCHPIHEHLRAVVHFRVLTLLAHAVVDR